MNKVGVIQVIDALNAGGAEVLAVNIANALSEKGFNSHLCATRKEGVLKNNIKNSTSYLFLNRKSSLDLSAIFKFKKYLKKHKIKIIHAHSTSSFFAFCVKIMYPKVKIIWHDHYGKFQELNLRNVFPLNFFTFFFSSIISVNTDLKLWAEKKLYCKNVFFLNNFPFFTNKESITKLQGIEGKRIVHLAGFRPQKDHETLIKAFKDFNNISSDWTLHLIGKVYEGEYSENILKLIKDYNLEEKVFIYDSCLDIENILNQSKIGVLPSKSEGLPVALLEYGLASLPVITTDVGECSNVVENNFSGLVVKPKNPMLLSKALTTLAESNNIRTDFSKRFHKKILDKYSRESFIKKLINIYLD